MGLPVFRDCCCCELKWGVLTVGIVDIILTLCLGGGNGSGYTGAARIVWFLALVIHVAHIVACVCVIVSVFKSWESISGLLFTHGSANLEVQHRPINDLFPAFTVDIFGNVLQLHDIQAHDEPETWKFYHGQFKI
ncbi:uncharacterized protein [Drosophila kikkawai]|uniref:Uncharacterized protein isoform X2 n=1 Tax=Drosophila kikkawai TaxID=30033 RepID=A0ABM4G9A1_DROKI